MNCPGKYCFLFVEVGDTTTNGVATAGHCHLGEIPNHSGCIRDSLRGPRDWYEPCEPELRKAGFSEDHFKTTT